MAAPFRTPSGSAIRASSSSMAAVSGNTEKNKKISLLAPIPLPIFRKGGLVGNVDEASKPPRRPRSKKPPPLPEAFFSPPTVPKELPLPPEDPKLACVYKIFCGQPYTETEVFRIIDHFIFFKAEGPPDLQKIVNYLIEMSMECSVNVVPIFKALYIITQNPEIGADVRGFVYEEVERRFKTRKEKILKGPDAARRFRNFVQLMLALVHHYRNLKKAPIHELVDGLYQLSVELSHFKFFDDVPLFVLLVLRVQYYTTLPPAIKDDTLPKIQRAHSMWTMIVLHGARTVARLKLSKDHELPPTYRKWLTLLIEARNSPKVYKEKELVQLYKDLPGFEKLMAKELMIKLPHDCERDDFSISHISEYVTFEEAPAVTEKQPALQEETRATVG